MTVEESYLRQFDEKPWKAARDRARIQPAESPFHLGKPARKTRQKLVGWPKLYYQEQKLMTWHLAQGKSGQTARRRLSDFAMATIDRC